MTAVATTRARPTSWVPVSVALARRFEADGGTLRLGDAAAHVEVGVSGVHAVQTANGDRINCRAVVAGCHILETVDLLGGNGILLDFHVMRHMADIEAILEEELEAALGRGRYERACDGARGHRNGHRERQVIGTFCAEPVNVPRARLVDDAGQVSEWRSEALRRYQRLTKKAEALIASVYLAGTNTRRVKRALIGLFGGAVSKDVVSRAWRKVKTDWEAWCGRSLAEEDIVRPYGLGVSSFITKPVTFEGLVEAVKAFCRYWIEIVALPPECCSKKIA